MRVKAPAKINLTLEVTGVEANGYHTLDTLFCWLVLHDVLDLSKAPQTGLEMTGAGVQGWELVSVDEDNLVLKALRALEATVGQELPTRFSLEKRIPAGGGLGGGSADAAAALYGLNEVHGLGLSPDELREIARTLGADVAFGLVGGFARGTGYGDRLQSLALPESLKERTLLLLHPDFPCLTPAVYKEWDKLRCQVAKSASDNFLAAEAPWEAVANDLEPAAFSLFPELARCKEVMLEAGLEGVALSGSGSTLFGFLSPEGSLPEVEKHLGTVGRTTVTLLSEETRFG